MINKPAKKTLLSLVVSAALILGANAAFAGEVNGKGEVIPGGTNGSSECSFSGQQDDDTNEGVFKSDRTQSWGQLFNQIRLALIASGFVPGSKFGLPGLGSCNPNAT